MIKEKLIKAVNLRDKKEAKHIIKNIMSAGSDMHVTVFLKNTCQSKEKHSR